MMRVRLDAQAQTWYAGGMSSAAATPAPWATLSLDERTDAILEAILCGVQLVDVKEAHGTTALAIVEHMSTPEYDARTDAFLRKARPASASVADLLKVSMLLNGKAAKDGLAYKELAMLLDKLGNNIQAEAPEKADDPEARAAAVRLVQENMWKYVD